MKKLNRNPEKKLYVLNIDEPTYRKIRKIHEDAKTQVEIIEERKAKLEEELKELESLEYKWKQVVKESGYNRYSIEKRIKKHNLPEFPTWNQLEAVWDK